MTRSGLDTRKNKQPHTNGGRRLFLQDPTGCLNTTTSRTTTPDPHPHPTRRRTEQYEGHAAVAGNQLHQCLRQMSTPHRHTRPRGLLDPLRGQVLLRKEVIQPHLPVRLPCYDFVPIASPTFDGSLPYGLGHRLRVLPTFVT